MKNFGLFLIASLLSVSCLTSCFKGSNISTFQAIGVFDLSNKSSVYVLKTVDGEIYANEFNSMFSKGELSLGTPLYAHYTIDFDLPENAPNVVSVNGYYTVTINSFIIYDKHYLSYSLTDTSKMVNGEAVVVDPFVPVQDGGISGFYDRYMFSTHKTQSNELNFKWDLSYGADAMEVVEQDGKRYYDLFLRATEDGRSSGRFNLFPVAYDMGSYLRGVAQKEKDALGSSYNENNSIFTLRLNYVSEIKEDSTIVWSKKEVAQYIATYL